MEIILLERIEHLGKMGDIVNVKTGYARNYLLPQKKALRSTKENLAYFESKRAELEAHNLKMKQDAEVAAKICTALLFLWFVRLLKAVSCTVLFPFVTFMKHSKMPD